MNHGNGGITKAPAGAVEPSVCPATGRDSCSLREVAAGSASARSGGKNFTSRCEIEVLLSLAPGHRIAVGDDIGHFWRATVDVTFPEYAFVWVFTDLGERKLIDIAIHTVWRLDTPLNCGDVRGDAGQLSS